MIVIITRININDELKEYLIQLLDEKFYASSNLDELSKINQIYKLLGHETESWLSAIQPKQ